MRIIVYIGIVISFWSCSSDDVEIQTESNEKKVEVKQVNPRLLRARDGQIGKYGNSFLLFDESCMMNFEGLFIDVGLWAQEVKLVEMLRFQPTVPITNETNVDMKKGSFIYLVYDKKTNESSEVESFSESYFYNEGDGQFIPLHLSSNGILVDSIYHVVLPHSKEQLGCGGIEFKKDILESHVGVWERVNDSTHEPIVKH